MIERRSHWKKFAYAGWLLLRMIILHDVDSKRNDENIMLHTAEIVFIVYGILWCNSSQAIQYLTLD